MKKLVLTAAAVVMVMSVQAENFVWSAADGADWTSLSNWKTYEPRVTATRLPDVGDSIYLGGKDWTFHCHADNAAECEIFQRVKQIRPLESGSTIIIDVPVGQEITIANKIANASNCDSGSLYIRGGGVVRLKATGMSDYYLGHLVVEEGTLYLPDNIDAVTVKQSYNLRHVVVSNNATLYLPSNFSPDTDSHINIYTLQGGGTIYNNRPSARTEVRITGNYPNNEFSGSFADGTNTANSTRIFLFCNGNFKLTGKSYANQAVQCMYGRKQWSLGDQRFAFKYFGKKGEPSSIGSASYITASVEGANFLYLGDGETTDKDIGFYPCATGYTTFDAGAVGGLTLGEGVDSNKGAVGGFTYGTKSGLMSVVGLNGSNTVPCVLCGKLNKYQSKDGSVTASPMVIKKGTGTWRFADPNGLSSKGRNFGGAIQVHEGVFQFDSISPIGEYCSVGDGTMLTEDDLVSYADATKVNWQFALGGKAANLQDDAEGTLEYTGTKDEYAADRPIVLRGNGRLRANSAGKIRYRMLPPEATKDVTLTLDGSSTADNEVADLVDMKDASDNVQHKLAVVKEGSGKWILSGTNSFTGGLTVKGGTLIVKKPNSTRYTWFKYTIKDMCDSFCRAYMGCTQHSKGGICVNNFGLYDAEGNNLIYELTCPDSTNIAEIAEGQAGLATDRTQLIGTGYTYLERGMTNMFGYASAHYGYNLTMRMSGSESTCYPQLSDPTTWLPIVMRLNPGTEANVASYDFAYYYSCKGEKHGLQWNPSVWSLEGSVDGIHWENVKMDAATAPNWTCTTNDYNTANYYFFFTKKAMNKNTTPNGGSVIKHSGGCEIKGESQTSYPVDISAVKVSGGSTFKVEGSRIFVGELDLDSSANTVENVAFNENGTFNVSGTLAKGESVTLGTTFTNCYGVENMVNAEKWTLKINGVARPSYTLAYEDGKLVVKRPGTVIIVR